VYVASFWYSFQWLIIPVSLRNSKMSAENKSHLNCWIYKFIYNVNVTYQVSVDRYDVNLDNFFSGGQDYNHNLDFEIEW